MDIPEEQRFSTILKKYSVLREIIYDQMFELCPLAGYGEPIDPVAFRARVCRRRRSVEPERSDPTKLREAGPFRSVGDNQIFVRAVRLTDCRTPVGRTHPSAQYRDTVFQLNLFHDAK